MPAVRCWPWEVFSSWLASRDLGTARSSYLAWVGPVMWSTGLSCASPVTAGAPASTLGIPLVEVVWNDQQQITNIKAPLEDLSVVFQKPLVNRIYIYKYLHNQVFINLRMMITYNFVWQEVMIMMKAFNWRFGWQFQGMQALSHILEFHGYYVNSLH